MSSRKPIVQILVGGTIGAAVVGVAYYYWKKKHQEELKKKFLFDPVEEAGMELREQILAMENGEPGVAKSPSESQKLETGLVKERFITINVKIPREHAKSFIGKFGNNVQKIQSETGTCIQSSRETLDNGDRVYVIKGAPSNVMLAEQEIKKFLMCQPIQRTATIQVPATAMGRIIGRGGETIRSFQDLSKARITTGDKDEESGYGDSELTRLIKIRGTDDQIAMALALIEQEVEAEENFRKKIKAGATGRTKRRIIPASMSVRSESTTEKQGILPFKYDGTMEVFVSCIYNPNKFFIQVVGTSSINLDNLCERMTEYYNTESESPESGEGSPFAVNDIVVASYELDNKMYRARVLDIEGEDAKIMYVDFGEKKILPISKLRKIKMAHLNLPFQAIEATLNLDYNGEWPSEIVNDFVILTECANWISMTAKVKDYLKNEDGDENKDIVWIELYNNNQMNIGDEIVRRLGVGSEPTSPSKGPSVTNSASSPVLDNGATLSYASKASKSTTLPTNGSEVPPE